MRNTKIKVIRTSTIAMSLNILLKGQLKYLNQFYNVKALSGKDKHLIKVKEREGVEIIPLRMSRKISIFNDLVSLIKMYQVLKKEKPDIVHSITPKAGLITMLAAKFAGVPIRMHTFTGLIFPYADGIMKKILILMDRLLCYSATHIYPEGNGVKEDLIKYNITNKPLKVIANGNINGIDTEFFKPLKNTNNQILKLKSELHIEDSHFVYCFVGRIVLEKGIRELFSAFKQLYKENKHIRLLLVGSFDENQKLNDQLSKEIEEHTGIISVGWQDDIRPYLSISDCFVFPSYREGFPNVVLQACAMELACIVTNISGSNEIIQNNKNGIIIPSKNTKLLKNAMKTLLNDSSLTKSFGKYARKTIVENFEQSKVWSALNNEYINNINQLKKKKLIRITTVPVSLDKLLEGQLRYMKNKYEVTAISSFENGYLKKVADREGIKFFSIKLTRAITPLEDLKSLWKMYNFLKKEKPLIVHTHTPKAGTIGMWAAKLAGVPIRIHTVAGLPLMETKGLKKFTLTMVEKMTYASANHVLPNSYGLKNYIIENKLTSEKKLTVIGNGSSNGINLDFFNPIHYTDEYLNSLRQKLNITKDDFVFIFVGRLVGDKGINELVSVFKNFKNNNLKLLLVGDLERDLDPLKDETLTETEKNKNIIITGWQADVRPYYAISHVLVFPSYREGFPNVVLQAGAMGLPAIVTDINGCNEIITHRKNGLIIPVKDTEALKKAMKLILENKILYHSLQQNSRAEIASKYNQRDLWIKMQEFYENLIKNYNEE